MPVLEQQRAAIHGFRRWLVEMLAGEADFRNHQTYDREDESTLADRWAVGESVWIEAAIRPLLPQIRVGLFTDDRWKSEELEQKIEESGDTMEEFVGFGFDDAGLDWEEPPVEHYRTGTKHFYFATPVDIESLDVLADAELRATVIQMVRGYRQAFGKAL